MSTIKWNKFSPVPAIVPGQTSHKTTTFRVRTTGPCTVSKSGTVVVEDPVGTSSLRGAPALLIRPGTQDRQPGPS